MGFLRLATNPAVFRSEALTLARAWDCYEQLAGDERVISAPEPEGMENWWKQFTQNLTYSHKIWSDAYLAAFARAMDSEAVTFDTGFKQYKEAKISILEAPV